jgi:hypothetical protein
MKRSPISLIGAFVVAGLVAGLPFASPAAGETIYKYRRADGQLIYSDRPLSHAALVEQFGYEPAIPVRSQGEPDKSLLEAEERIRNQLAARDHAWQEVQDARLALARAEERLRAGAEPTEDEPKQLVGPGNPAPPAAGGPQTPARPASGGPQPSARPAVGGPMGSRHGGGGRSAEYQARTKLLEANVVAAQARLDVALGRYNALR